MRDFTRRAAFAFPRHRWLANVISAAFISFLALAFALSGCSKNDAANDKEPAVNAAPAPESVAQNEPEPEPEVHNRKRVEDPDRLRLEEQPKSLRERGAVFMGTHALGKRFCIVADASNSMKGASLDQLKQEIMRTLNDLDPSSQFYVIFFNATDHPMHYPSWLDASKKNVDDVRPWVENMTTQLRTLPNSAFDRAFKLDPKPDVVFFMTDGFLQGPDPIKHLNALNAAGPKVVVHTIMFTKKRAVENKNLGRATSQLRAMAEQNGGTFRHVNQKQ
jgi:hypothetical protein